MKPPIIRLMYAIVAMIPASQPLSLYLLSKIRPIAKIKSPIPTKEIYIFSMEVDISFPPRELRLLIANRIIPYGNGDK